MRFRSSGILALAAILLPTLATSASAQDEQYEWRGDRPDGFAPTGVVVDHNLSAGELLVGYRFGFDNMDGLQAGQFEVPIIDVLDVFQTTPIRMQSQWHTVSAQYAPSDNVSVLARVPFRMSQMDRLSRDGFVAGTSSSGLGDVRVDGVAKIYDTGPYRAHLSAGVSVPTGSQDLDDVDDFSGSTVRLPYSMQTGSGTFDIHPGITLEAMNQHGSVGLQAMGTLRNGENDFGYTLGNRVHIDGWAGFLINEQLSLSARVSYQQWDQISGRDVSFDAGLDALSDPSIFPDAQGGSRLLLPLGVNLHMNEGPLAGHRLGLEWVLPISQDLDGPQLQSDWGVMIGWQKVIGR